MTLSRNRQTGADKQCQVLQHPERNYGNESSLLAPTQISEDNHRTLDQAFSMEVIEHSGLLP